MCVSVCVCVGVCVRPSDLVQAVTFFSNRIFLNNLAHKYIIMRRCVATYLRHLKWLPWQPGCCFPSVPVRTLTPKVFNFHVSYSVHRYRLWRRCVATYLRHRKWLPWQPGCCFPPFLSALELLKFSTFTFHIRYRGANCGDGVAIRSSSKLVAMATRMLFSVRSCQHSNSQSFQLSRFIFGT